MPQESLLSSGWSGLVGLATSLVAAPQERSIEDTMFISERRTNDDEGEAAVGGVGVVGL